GRLALSLILLAAVPARAGAPADVSGPLVVDGKTVALTHAYLDRTDPTEPIVVLSSQPLPADAIPFIPEKLVKDLGLYAVAFSYSAKDGKLTNTFGKLHCPGHEMGVGLGRVEDGALKLAARRFDASSIDGTISTTKPVELSYITYSFELT